MFEGELSEAEIEERFHNDVVRKDLAPQPLRALFLGGQPGTGKSTLLPELSDQSEFGGRQPVWIDPDRYRMFYPEMCRGNTSHDPATAAAVYGVLNRWVDMAIDYAASTRRNALVDGTLGNCHTFERRSDRFLGARFKVQVVILAVPWVIGRINVVKRFLLQYRPDGSARRVSVDHQKAAFEGILETAKFIDESHTVDRVDVYRIWHPTLCHRASPVDAPDPGTRAVIEAERRNASPEAASIYTASRDAARRRHAELAGTIPEPLHGDLGRDLDEIDREADEFFGRGRGDGGAAKLPLTI